MIQFDKNVKNRLLVVVWQSTDEQAKQFNTSIKSKLRELAGTLNTASRYESLTDKETFEIKVLENKCVVSLLVGSDGNYFGAYNFTNAQDESGDNYDFSAIVAELGKDFKTKTSLFPADSIYKYSVQEA